MQAQGFEKDKNYFSFSYGFGSYFSPSSFENTVKNNLSYTNTSISSNSLGPLSFKYERAVSEKVGIGISVNYLSNSFKITKTDLGTNSNITGNYNLNRTTFSILARMNLHFVEGEKFDPYWGIGIGYRTTNWKQEISYSDETFTDPNPEDFTPPIRIQFPFGFETVFGTRYFVGPNFALFGELGLAKAVLQVGVTGKF